MTTRMTSAEPTSDALARLYDLDLLDDPGDLDLYLALADRAGGEVLELAAGSGRIAVPLVEAGFATTGVDLDPAMLARARQRADSAGSEVSGRLRLIEADVRHVRIPGDARFALGIVALNSLMLLGGRHDQAAAVATLAAHLRSGGLAAIDVWVPDADDLARFDGRITLEYARHDPPDGALVTKAASAIHDAATGTVRLSAIWEEGRQGDPPVRWFREDVLRLVSPDELAWFAEAAGLVVETIAGGYDLEPLGPGSDRAVLIATKP